MSKLCERIEAIQTGRYKLDLPRMMEIRSETDHTDIMGEKLTQYRLGVSLTMKGFIKDTAELEYFKERARRAIIHEVFSEFKPIINKMYEAAFERDWVLMRESIDELHERMFK